MEDIGFPHPGPGFLADVAWGQLDYLVVDSIVEGCLHDT